MRFTVVLVAVMVLLGCGKSSGPPAPPPDASATPGASATPARQARIAKLARGTSVAYALLVDGTIHRWGLVAVRTREDAPVAMTGLVGKFVDVSADRHACAVNDAGEVWCWGENAFGALGNGTSVPLGSSEMGPVKALVSDAKSVCVDGLFSCALHRTGTVSCWGNGPWGRDVHHEVPVLMPGFTRVTSIACGGAHLCAVDEDGVLRCMGRGVAGALGDRKRGDFYRPTPVVAAGVHAAGPLVTDTCFTCAAVDGDRVRCWGVPFSRRCSSALPTPVPEDSSETTEVDDGKKRDGGASPWFADVTFRIPRVVELQRQKAIGGVCARSSDGRVHCWGASEDKSRVRRDEGPVFGEEPTLVDGLGGATHLTESCASVLRDGARRDAIVCWGEPLARFDAGPEEYSWNVRLAPAELPW